MDSRIRENDYEVGIKNSADDEVLCVRESVYDARFQSTKFEFPKRSRPV
jgi:hypothetical protein